MEHVEILKAKLGFDGPAEGLLTHAIPLVTHALADFGHDVLDTTSPSGRRVSLELDEYRVSLVHKRQLNHGWTSQQTRGDTLEIRLTPLFPLHNDRELSETLLACVLHHTITQLPVQSVLWLDWPNLLTRAQFLSVFQTVDIEEFAPPQQTHATLSTIFDTPPAEPTPSPAQDMLTTAEVLLDSELLPDTAVLSPDEAAMARAQLRRDLAHDGDDVELRPAPASNRHSAAFAPIEQTAQDLSVHCEQMLNAAEIDDDSAGAPVRWTSRALEKAPQHVANLSLTAVIATVSAPAALIAGTVNFVRGGDLKFSLQLLLLLTVALYLDSAGIVRAALELIPFTP